jgi:hypothetical protein
MLCRHCKVEVNVLDSICHSCGKPLSALYDSSRPGSRSSSLLEQTSQLLDHELEEAKRSVLGERPCKEASASGGMASFRLKGSRAPEKLNLITGNDFELKSSHADIYQMAAFVFHSAHVQSNKLYCFRAEQTTFRYFPDNFEVNAGATDDQVQGIEDKPPLILVYGGVVLAARLTSLGLSIDQMARTSESRQLLLRLIQGIGSKIMGNKGLFNRDDTLDLLNQMQLGSKLSNKNAIRQAKSIEASMVFNVIAHELGHICLGHTLGRSQNLEVSRNQEREADSFAASVASASIFSDHLVAGGIFWWVIMCWEAKAAGKRTDTTHPHSRERLFDYIRANREQALSLGIDEENIKEFLQ